MIVLDTNVYVDAIEDEDRAARLATLVESSDDVFAISSVVVAELLIGLKDARHREELLASVFDTVESGRVLTPTHEDWERAGDAMRSLGGNGVTARRSFWNHLLIAASCARAGATRLTRNPADFRRIGRVIPVLVDLAWR